MNSRWMMWARLKSLYYADTTVFELFNVYLALAWSFGINYYTLYYARATSFTRIDDVILHAAVAYFLVPVALLSFFSILTGYCLGRRIAAGLSMLWWSWLAALMYQYPPNYSAAITHFVMAVFCMWAVFSLRDTEK